MTRPRQFIEQLISFSAAKHHITNPLKTVDQPYPEAMFADQVFELDVSSVPADVLADLVHALSNNDLRVQRLSHSANQVSHLRIWPTGESACARQQQLVIDQLTSFNFAEGWQWRSTDPRDLVFALPRRLSDERTWVVGANIIHRAEGSQNQHRSHVTLALTFSERNSVEIAEIAIYIRNDSSVSKMLPGQGFVHTETAPELLFS